MGCPARGAAAQTPPGTAASGKHRWAGRAALRLRALQPGVAASPLRAAAWRGGAPAWPGGGGRRGAAAPGTGEVLGRRVLPRSSSGVERCPILLFSFHWFCSPTRRIVGTVFFFKPKVTWKCNPALRFFSSFKVNLAFISSGLCVQHVLNFSKKKKQKTCETFHPRTHQPCARTIRHSRRLCGSSSDRPRRAG